MRILYGVVGEGMGHAMRSRVVLEHLVRENHEVEIMASGRAVDFLSKRFDEVRKIHGYHLIYEENRVRLGKTVWSNVLAGTGGVPENIAAYFELLTSFRPEVVISDFESWTYLYGKTHKLPVLSIDNMQIISRCTHDDEIVRGYETDFQLARAFVKSKLPFSSEYFITTFFHPAVRKERTRLFPPILRPEIEQAKAIARRGDHLLVYQTAEGNEGLARALASANVECRVYGMRRQIQEEQVEGNLRYMPFSETRFIEDLATARAVIAGGGFTLMGEAVYLQKPMLSLPVRRQFEQVLNARYLEKLGYGREASQIDAEAVKSFLDIVPRCEEKLASYTQDGNRELFRAVDEFLDRAAAGLV
ncbi:teichoic acid biosynthesis protein [Pendulispora rubella]|uniref:Teichoic acid biosynthesis protein n=1 Tax=Pendulispora rubella TaxID=2741070 RepID=A0ABZ2L9Y0_9BACT